MKYHQILSGCLFVPLALYSQTPTLHPVLKQTIELSDQTNRLSNETLSKSWLNPFSLSLSLAKNATDNQESTTRNITLSIDQPIFKSGGILALKKRTALVEQRLVIENKKNKSDALLKGYTLLFEMKKNRLLYDKMRRQVDNSQKESERKAEMYRLGLLDSSFVENAIVSLHTYETELIDLATTYTTLKYQAELIFEAPVETIALPTLSLLSQEQFLEKNSYLAIDSFKKRESYENHKEIRSHYLPQLSLSSSYTRSQNSYDPSTFVNKNSTFIGVNASMPLWDFSKESTNQHAKISYLLAQNNEEKTRLEEIRLLKESLAKINALDKKISLSFDTLKRFETLLTMTQEQFKAGQKIEDDVSSMTNEYEIKKLESDILRIDKQITLLTLYGRLYDSF